MGQRKMSSHRSLHSLSLSLSLSHLHSRHPSQAETKPHAPTATQSPPQPEDQDDDEPIEYDTLTHLLHTLDGHDRATHIGTLKDGVHACVARLHVTVPMWNSLESSFAPLQVQRKQAEEELESLKMLQIGLHRLEERQTKLGIRSRETTTTRQATDRRVVAAESALAGLEDHMTAHRIALDQTRDMHAALTRWVSALKDLSGFWEAVWDVYDMMTKPGPSSAAGKGIEMWKDGYHAHLWTQLMLIKGRVQAAERDVAGLGPFGGQY